MNRSSWSPEDRTEYDDMIERVCADVDSTTERVDLLEQRVVGAAESGRSWANDVQRTALRDGLRRSVKSWLDRNRALFSHAGDLISKPRIIGAKRAAADGSIVSQQTLFDLMSWDEIRAKVREYLTQQKAYEVNVALGMHLLSLEERCPAAANPHEACEQLGITVEEYLAQGEAEAV